MLDDWAIYWLLSTSSSTSLRRDTGPCHDVRRPCAGRGQCWSFWNVLWPRVGYLLATWKRRSSDDCWTSCQRLASHRPYAPAPHSVRQPTVPSCTGGRWHRRSVCHVRWCSLRRCWPCSSKTPTTSSCGSPRSMVRRRLSPCTSSLPPSGVTASTHEQHRRSPSLRWCLPLPGPISTVSGKEGGILATLSVAKRALITTGMEVTEDDAGSPSRHIR